MALTGQQFTIADGDYEATIVEVGAGLRRFTHRGVDVANPYDENSLPPKGSGAVLVPWPNRIRDGRYRFDGADYQLPLTDVPTGTASHGLGRWARWTPVTYGASSVTLALDIVPQSGWPFEVRVSVTYALDATTGLAVTLVADNHGQSRAPFGAGCHPYAFLHGYDLSDVVLELPARQRLIADDHQVPVGTQAVDGTPYDFRSARRLGDQRLDDGYAELPADGTQIDVTTPAGGARIWFDASFGFTQVFTREAMPGNPAAVAVEPMSCPADAFNSGQGVVVLEPGGTWTGTWGMLPLLPL